jgi:broad specificity phosphatase PhoE
MTTLLFVRHGPTDWTGLKRMQGRTDIDLSVDGRHSVADLAPLIAAWKPRTLIASPLSRARTTASLLSDLDPIFDDRWAEAGLGEWEGLRATEIGADYALWRAGQLIPPGGEETAAVSARVTAAVRTAVAQPGPVLIVTHGGTIRSVLANFVGLTVGHLEPVGAPSLTVLDVEADGAARLCHYNLQANMARLSA